MLQRTTINYCYEYISVITINEKNQALSKMKANKARHRENKRSIQYASTQGTWNNAITILLHKKGDKLDLENHTPNNLLNHLYRVSANSAIQPVRNNIQLNQVV